MAHELPFPPLPRFNPAQAAARAAWIAAAQDVQDYSVRTLGYIDWRITQGVSPEFETPELSELLARRVAAHEAYSAIREAADRARLADAIPALMAREAA